MAGLPPRQHTGTLIRAVNAAGPGPWSDYAQATTPASSLPSPPASLGIDPFYRKYLDFNGVAVISPADVPDEKLYEARDVLASMISTRPDLLKVMADLGNRVVLFVGQHGANGAALKRLPELKFKYVPEDTGGVILWNFPNYKVASVPT